jgi:hypothetical protein
MNTRRMMVATFVAVVAAVVTLAGAAWAAVFSNASSISILTSGRATPYPATVDVFSGLSGTVTDLNVTLHGVSEVNTSALLFILSLRGSFMTGYPRSAWRQMWTRKYMRG